MLIALFESLVMSQKEKIDGKYDAGGARATTYFICISMDAGLLMFFKTGLQG